ncbi:N-acetylmuramoyl-L-alanine amidase [Nocardiopsis sp. NRRL B-16309]|uniref:N-acetylmuramoyl-L-alanine amidase n=1 Tax=Nocardiopsis sp. NRRL B-16309 TaxID=1519494 RepID=UPI0006AFECBD|nr:N-acetylmuramoyl-L-alanine amidase [Nocardiopsis sp. NRRL B-16309]KOX17100.1 cell wall hydrolase [Nocardiopsis sp. NRRL B-16309]
MPASVPAGPRSRAVRALSLVALTTTVLFATACASGSGAAPEDDPTAAIPLPGPEDGGAGTGAGPGTSDSADDAARPSDGPGAGDGAADGPLGTRVVLIDPGHNGGNAEAPDEINAMVSAGPERKACDTVGAESGDGYPEHEFNWDLALLVKERLEADGATVVLTRDDNESVGPCIDERAAIGNETEADAALSIHADGAPASGRGFHVIAPGEVDGFTEDIVEPSRLLAEDLRREYREGSGIPYADYLDGDGLDERTDLGGLNLSTVPKVFLEAGNMRNEEDAALLSDPAWQEEAADAIARGLAVYLMRE